MALIEAKQLLEVKVEERTNELTCLNEELRAMNEELLAMNEEVLAINEELRQAKAAADLATRAKSTFITNMSHEIRTPMNAILGFSQLLQRETTLNAQQRQYLNSINQAGIHLLELIDGILDMAKIEAGRIALRPTATDLPELLRDIGQMFYLKAEEKGLDFAIDIAEDLPRVVMLDEGRLRQVLINLLGNAVKFTSEGGIILRASFAYENAENLRLAFAVEDTGCGIDPQDMERLFQTFEQASAGLEAGSGAGLGLAISREIVRLMKGDITVSSQPGKGSSFQFYIHVQRADEKDVAKHRINRRVKAVRSGSDPYRVMIVDDAELNRTLLAILLEKVGFAICQASNGQEAIELAAAWRPDIILMDIKMPAGMDGFEAIRQIRANPDLGYVPIIVVTASAFAEERQKAIQIGADDFLTKPFEEADLFETMGNLLQLEYEFEQGLDEESNRGGQNDVRLKPEMLDVLPSEIIGGMRDAVLEGDYYTILTLAEQAKAHDANVAAALTHMTQQYQFEQLIELLAGE